MNQLIATLESSFRKVDWMSILESGGRIFLWLIIFFVALRLITAVIARLETRLIQRGKVEGEPASEAEKRAQTLTKLLRQGLTLVLLGITLLGFLKEFGVDIRPILASAGVLGLAIGFGAQNLVKDVISGFFILLENQVRVGDVAVVNGTGGLVEAVNFRTILLRDLSGTVHIFPNGSIDTLSNMTKGWSAYVFDIGVAYKEDVDQVTKIIQGVDEDLRKDVEFSAYILEPIEIFGLDKFDDSALIIKARLKTKPIKQWAVGREFNRRLKIAFDQQGIEIPFPHRTLVMANSTNSLEPLLQRD